MIHPATEIKKNNTVTEKNNPITFLMDQAAKEPRLSEKRKIYQEVYQVYRQGPITPQFFEFLETYAKATCYGQAEKVDPEMGFKKSALLMELSFSLQLQEMGIQAPQFDWKKFELLEELIKQLGEHFLPFMEEFKYEPTELARLAKEKNLRNSMGKTLVRLCFSYQNIKARIVLDLQQTYHSLTVAVIGKETPESKRQLFEFFYNREPFMSYLKSPKDHEAALESLKPVCAFLEECYEPTDVAYLRKKAQLDNKLGSIYENLAAQKYREAFKISCDLVNHPSLNDAERFTQMFLSANSATYFGADVLKHEPFGEEDRADLQLALKALNTFIEEAEKRGDNNSYIDESHRKMKALFEAKLGLL